MWAAIAPQARSPARVRRHLGATGAEPATGRGARLSSPSIPTLPVRATGTYLGHGVEPQFPMNIALAALALGHGKLFPPADDSGVERPWTARSTQVVVTGVGHWRGEGMALVEAARLKESAE